MKGLGMVLKIEYNSFSQTIYYKGEKHEVYLCDQEIHC